MGDVILHLSNDEVTALATALTVARALFEQDASRIEQWLQPDNPEQVADSNDVTEQVRAGIVDQVQEWKALESSIAKQRVLDAKMKRAFANL